MKNVSILLLVAASALLLGACKTKPSGVAGCKTSSKVAERVASYFNLVTVICDSVEGKESIPGLEVSGVRIAPGNIPIGTSVMLVREVHPLFNLRPTKTYNGKVNPLEPVFAVVK